jgi:hypothetical protein
MPALLRSVQNKGKVNLKVKLHFDEERYQILLDFIPFRGVEIEENEFLVDNDFTIVGSWDWLENQGLNVMRSARPYIYPVEQLEKEDVKNRVPWTPFNPWALWLL